MAAIYGAAAHRRAACVERDLGPARAGYFSQLPYLALYAFNERARSDPSRPHAQPGLPVRGSGARRPQPAARPGAACPVRPTARGSSTLTEGCGGSATTYYINPLGFAFEHFDGMGRLRDARTTASPIDSAARPTRSPKGYKAFADVGGADAAHGGGASRRTPATRRRSRASRCSATSWTTDLPMLEALTAVSMAPAARSSR